MRILLGYDPHNPLPESSARLISELLRREGFELEIMDLSERQINVLTSFDAVVLGGTIWFGKVSGGLADYLETNHQELLIKPLFLYLHSYVGTDEFLKQTATNISLELLEHAYTANLGLKVIYDQLGLLDKLRWKLTHQEVEVEDSVESAKNFVDVISSMLH